MKLEISITWEIQKYVDIKQHTLKVPVGQRNYKGNIWRQIKIKMQCNNYRAKTVPRENFISLNAYIKEAVLK